MKNCNWLLLCIALCFAMLLSVGATAVDETLPVPSKPYCCHGTEISGQQGVYVEVTALTGVEGYVIYRSTDGVSYTEVGTSGFSMYIDTGVEEGVTYYYKVACYYDGSVGEASEPTAYTFVRLPERPVLQPITFADGHPVLTWTASDAQEGDTYMVLRGLTENELFEIAEITEMTYTDTARFAAGTTYYYGIAVNRDGLISYSKVVAVTIESDDTSLPVPNQPFCAYVYGSDSQTPGVRIRMFDYGELSAMEGFIYYRSTDGVSYTEIARGVFTNYVDTDVEEGVTYYYKVACYLNGVDGEASEAKTYTFRVHPWPPVLQPITLADGHPVITWTVPDAQEGDTYEVFRGKTENQFKIIAEVTELTYTDTEDLPDGTYYYKVNSVRNGAIGFGSDRGVIRLCSDPPTGDASGDGNINLVDALRVLRYTVDDSLAIEWHHADFNMDGKVDIADALSILRFIVNS